MKNVGLLIPNLQSGGSERIVSRLSLELHENFNIHIILFDKSNISYNYAGNLIDIGLPAKNGLVGKAFNAVKRILKLRKIVKENEIDIVLSFTSAANNCLAFSFANCKKIISCRGFNYLKQNLKHHKLLLNLTDGILFNSKAQQEFYSRHFPKDKNKLFALYNLFDNKDIELKALETLSPKEQDFFESHKVIATVSRFCYEKGQWNLLKAFELLKEDVPDAGLVFVGHTGKYEEDIKKMAQKSKYKDDILFAGFQKNPFKYVAKSDVYALCSLNEGFPNSLVEAMIVKTKAVATDCKTGPSEILFKNFNPDFECDKMTVADYGIITPAFNGEVDFDYKNIDNSHIEYKNALKEAILGLNEEIPEKAYEKCNEFDSKAIINEYVKLINKLIERKR